MVRSFSLFISIRRGLAIPAFLSSLALVLIGCAGYTQSSPTSQPAAQTPSLTLSASSFSFNTVVVGETLSQPLKITNTGNASLEISSVSLSNSQFSVSGPNIPASILPSTSLPLTVSFSPTAAGSTTATLTIRSNASTGMTTVPLSGTGQKAFANLVVSPASISFGNLDLKATSKQNVTLQNTGDISMTIQGITVAGAGFGYASLSPGFTLAPNQSVIFQAWFAPTVNGPASATVSFLSASLSSPVTLSLSGDGISPGSPPTPPPPPPPPPVQHTVKLSWNASVGSVIGYKVYRSEVSGSSYGPLTVTAINALTYTDATVASGTTYYYVVTSVDSAGVESAYSNQVTAAVPSP